MEIVEEVKAKNEANKDHIYRFWFSAKQQEAISEEERPYRPQYVTIDGKRQEYTECMRGDHLEKKSNWDDAIYLGETSWRNIG